MGERNRKIPRGFTLIELLVVVAIITLLVAILLPSLRSARSQAKRVVCRNNMRCIWTGILTYSLEYKDRVPFMEDVNRTDPNADPFDSNYPSTVGNVLLDYVHPGSWKCPSAVAGYPANASPEKWQITYSFSVAGGIGEGIPYDEAPGKDTGGPLDPAMSNYVHFDGRPLRLMDGRRYVVGWGLNQNSKGYWNVRRAIIADRLAGDPAAGRPRYPHHGAVRPRLDLENAREQFEINTFGAGKQPAYHELHADSDKTEILLTRYWAPHQDGF